VVPGLKVDLFASEPDVRNPVALSIDERGRVFVVESDRRRSSVFDIRGHKDWLEKDLSFRTVQDRIDFLKQQVSPTNPAVIKRLLGSGGNGSFADFNKDGVVDWRDLEVQTERIRLLEDTDGDGRADRVGVFADGFTNMVAGVAAGVLARGETRYFARIPDLWKFSGDGRTNLLSGFGVHIAFGGHDMHGLIFGPDGRLYWSIADRGTDTNLFAKIKDPIPGLTPELLADSGCIFRANPDGSDFEVIAWGLRNPQELAFDEFGNLFAADNNGDGGDKARWHHVVEGADFGWRIGWQWLETRAYQPKMGPWNGERLWHLADSNTAAYLLPPLAHIGHGPAGLAYNPGTGLPSQFDRHFFLCDFPGHVLMWTNIPDGASFKVGPVKNFFGDLGPTDVAFHPDGGVLVSDWFKSFDKSDKGRIYRIHDPATDASQPVQETKRLLSEGMAKRTVKDLAALLGHRSRRHGTRLKCPPTTHGCPRHAAADDWRPTPARSAG
jgi:quinoprotein glucose dehydrogenase